VIDKYCFFLILLSISCVSATETVSWPDHITRGVNLGGVDRYSEEDIAHLALDWRVNSVRILKNDIIPSTAPFKLDEQTRADLYDLIGYCMKYRLYTVLAFSPSFRDQDAFFSNRAFMDAYKEFWIELATHYADSAGVAYDLMNEPHGDMAVSLWPDYAAELTAAIREVDTVHTIVVEPCDWGWPAGFEHLVPTGDTNTVYGFHFYGPMDYTHQRYADQMMNTPDAVWLQRAYPGTIVSEWGQEYWDKETMRSYVQKATAFKNRYGVRLWCGEFGCARWAIGADRWFADWISLLDEAEIGWSYYSYREWHHMDIEMDPDERVNSTGRGETELVTQFRQYFSNNEVPADFDRDGDIETDDIIALIVYQINYQGSLAADFNRDGRATVADALSMLLASRNTGNQ
jgi:endoglucanase